MILREPSPGAAAEGGPECLVIGGSAGAIDALLKLLPPLPRDFSLPVVVVVHLPPDQPSLLPTIFAPRCQIPVKEAEDKETIVPGTIYFAPPNYHLLVESDRTFSLSADEPVFFSRPAIDVLFESAADAYGNGLRAVVLTGASNDGTAGAEAVLKSGGAVWAQLPTVSEAPFMPQSVLEKCAPARAMDLAELSQEILALAPPSTSSQEGTR